MFIAPQHLNRINLNKCKQYKNKKEKVRGESGEGPTEGAGRRRPIYNLFFRVAGPFCPDPFQAKGPGNRAIGSLKGGSLLHSRSNQETLAALPPPALAGCRCFNMSTRTPPTTPAGDAITENKRFRAARASSPSSSAGERVTHNCPAPSLRLRLKARTDCLLVDCRLYRLLHRGGLGARRLLLVACATDE